MASRSVSVILQAQVAGFVNGMRTAQRAVDQLTGATDAAAKKRAQLSALGDAAGKVGLVAAAGLGAAVLAAANFDQAMSKVQAATHESAANMDLLREAALKAGADTAFSASEAAGGIEALAKAGVSTTDILNGGLTGALNLAAAGGQSVSDAAESAATSMTQFGLIGADVPHIADLLAAAAGKAQGEVSDMSAALNQTGLVAGQMGLSIEETTGSLAAFASAGLIGSDAGTSLKNALLRMANPSKEAAETMQSLGIAAYDAQGNFVGMEDLAGQLQGAFKGQSQAQRDAALATIFGSDAIRVANVLYEEGASGIAKWTDKVNDQGYAAETAAIQMDNLKGDLDNLGGAFETALIGLGEGAQGPLRSLVQSVTGAVNAFNELPPVAKSTASALLAITAVLGGGLWFGAKVIQGVAATRAALVALNLTAGGTVGAMRLVAASTATLATGAAAGAAVGLGLLVDRMDDVSLGAEQTKRALDNLAVGKVDESISHLTGSAESLGDALHNAAFSDLNFVGIGAKDEIEALDQAMASLANQNPEKAAKAFETIRDQAREAGLSTDELLKLFPELDAAMENVGGPSLRRNMLSGVFEGVAEAANDGARAIAKAQKANEAHAQAARRDAEAIQGQIDAMRDARSEAIRAANAQINYQASIDDATQAAKDNGRTIDITTEKGRANRLALIGMAEAWNGQSKAAKNTIGAHAEAVKTFVRVAVQMGMNAEKARAYANRLFEIPTRRETKVDADTKGANDKLDATQGKADKLNGTKPKPKVDAVTSAADADLMHTMGLLGQVARQHPSPTVTANTASANAALSALQARMAAIDGSTATATVVVRRIGGQAPGSAFATGGYTGDGGKHEPAGIVHKGEFVLDKETTARAFPLIAALHRNKGRMFGYADGGPVGHTTEAAKAHQEREDKQRDRHRKEMQKHAAGISKELKKHTDHLKEIRDKTRDLQNTVAANFKSDTFGQNFTLQGALASLRSDAARAGDFRDAARRAKRLGLDGGVFRALLASGNTAVLEDIDSRADVRRLEAAWRARNKATANLTFGTFGSAADVAKERRIAEHLRAELHHLNRNLKHLDKSVEEGARRGTKEHRQREHRHRQARARQAVAP